MQRFPLAPMSGLILWLTVLVLPLPLVLFYAASRAGVPTFAWLTALFVAGVYVIVWVYMRPSYFELSESSLDIVWPIRRFSMPLTQVESIELMSGREFRSRFGLGVRIGAGGLWGGFGLFKTRSVTFRFYISRMDDYVVITRGSEHPLLITPADPERFVNSLQSLTSSLA